MGIHFREGADFVRILELTPELRKQIEITVENLIAILDRFDGDENLEETGDEHDVGTPEGWRKSSHQGEPILEDDEDGHDAEQDNCDDEDGGDTELNGDEADYSGHEGEYCSGTDFDGSGTDMAVKMLRKAGIKMKAADRGLTLVSEPGSLFMRIKVQS